MENWQIVFLIHIMNYWWICIYYDNFYKNFIHLKDSIEGSIKNQLFVTLPFVYLFMNNYPIENNNILLSVILIPFLVIVADFYFYITHRLAHKYLWFIHKYHHKGKNYAVKSLDAHMTEHLICNLGSIVFGLYCFKYYNIIINIYILYLWIAFTTINTCLTHTEDYDKKGDHLIHHKYLHYNYGVGFYIMDKVIGTYKTFPALNIKRESKEI
jgi:sterol desaturase/sphingolipid hydroxylase (fatty acid hydroxylase superfamily)